MFYFIPTTNSTDLISITASQNVKENERGNSRLWLIILVSVLAIQLILTLLISVKIFCVSYKSTLNLVLKKSETTDKNLPIIGNKTLGNKHHNKNSESSKQKKREGESNAKYNPKESLECITSNPSGYVTDDPDAITAIPNDILCCNHQLNSPGNTQNDIRCTRKTRAILLPTAEDFDNSTSVTGVHKLPVPLTKVVLCLSNSDITCSISLTLQLICLCITHMLTVFSFKIAGQEVSLERYMLSVYSMEVAFLINTMVDPIVCIIFSSNYRNAAKAIMTLRRSTYKTSKYTQCQRLRQDKSIVN